MPKMSGGEAVVHGLIRNGVDVMFGIISVHTLHLFNVLRDVQDKLKLIGGRSELGCGFMADGYARSTGTPGVISTSSGPGAANSMHAMGEAYHSGSPILQITTNIEQNLLNQGTGALHEPKEQLQMFNSVTGWNSSVDSVELIPQKIDQAFNTFKTKIPRPAVLEIPTNLLGDVCDVSITTKAETDSELIDTNSIEKIADGLIESKRPLIWVGEEIGFTGGTDQIIELAEMLGVPVVTGSGAKGFFPEDHPLCLGQALGNRIWGTNPIYEFIPTCDLLLAIGSSLDYRSTRAVDLRMPAKLIQITLKAESIGKNFPVDHYFVGNGGVVVEQLVTLLKNRVASKGDAFKREVEQMKTTIYEDLKLQWPNEVYVMEALRSALPRETITCWDTTIPASRAARAFPAYLPRTFINPHGWVGIGFGFPAALGAKVGNPNVPVVGFTGDGGFQYCMAELATAVQYDLNAIVVMFNDDAWGVLKAYQANEFDNRYIGTDLVNPNFVKLVESYGLNAVRADTVSELIRAIEAGTSSPSLMFIEVPIPGGLASLKK